MKIGSPQQLERALGNAPLQSVYLLSCDEPLTSGEAADAVRRAAREQGFADREVFFVERTAPWAEILGSAQAMSLFSSRKIVEIRMPGGKPGHGAKTLLEIIRAAGPDLLLLIITERLDYQAQKAEWVEAVNRAGAWVDLPSVATADFPDWIRARAGRAGLRLDEEAVAVLAARTEGNLLAAHQEIAEAGAGRHRRRPAPPRCSPASARAATSMSSSSARRCWPATAAVRCASSAACAARVPNPR